MLGTNIQCLDDYWLVSAKTVVIILNLRYKLNKFPKYRVNEFYNLCDVVRGKKIYQDHCGDCQICQSYLLIVRNVYSKINIRKTLNIPKY